MITLTLNLADGRTIEVSMQRDQAEDLSEQIQDQLEDLDDEADNEPLALSPIHQNIKRAIWIGVAIVGALHIYQTVFSHPTFADFGLGALLLIAGTVAFLRTFENT